MEVVQVRGKYTDWTENGRKWLLCYTNARNHSINLTVFKASCCFPKCFQPAIILGNFFTGKTLAQDDLTGSSKPKTFQHLSSPPKPYYTQTTLLHHCCYEFRKMSLQHRLYKSPPTIHSHPFVNTL